MVESRNLIEINDEMGRQGSENGNGRAAELQFASLFTCLTIDQGYCVSEGNEKARKAIHWSRRRIWA